MEKLDYKKVFKDLYQPKAGPHRIHVPPMKFIQIDGHGNPNDPDGEYSKAVELLYTLSYSIKMAPRHGTAPLGYFDYVVPPLEGLWWLEDSTSLDFTDKSKYCWTSMIRQPDFVNEEVFDRAVQLAQKKKPELDGAKARLVTFTEGLCVQCLHIGSFDEEPETQEKMNRYAEEQGLLSDLSDTRRHHELYLSDPRKADRAKMKTILRHPVRIG
ncbi:GyrI-like domain-containing protein [Gorillibacterium sp. CAU 1737]|uniref:GyrI-like domain-containing protein n=1 Tax=Gorillibacterium sp. CAU 1737 TaxID=3140362 RepID=UPI0032617B0B